MTETATATDTANVAPLNTLQVVQTFKTPDGRHFTSKEDAMIHMVKPQFDARIDAYLKSRAEWPKGTEGRIRSVVSEFLGWEELQK